MNDIEFLREHQHEVCDLHIDVPGKELFQERLSQLLSIARFEDLLAATHIQYLAPADAMRLDLEAESIDYHVSFTVLEHIPAAILQGIFQEGRRLLNPEGLFVHYIDFTDHFAHSDERISSVNFLQFSDREWQDLAGNRFMFHNRLRVDDFRALFRGLGLEIISLDGKIDDGAIEVMKQRFTLSERFRTKDLVTNATMDGWLVASPGK